MIRGITHDVDDVLIGRETWRGKISTGYAPGEAPGGKNRGPEQAHFLRIMRKVSETLSIPGSTETTRADKWVLNAPIQKLLEGEAKSEQPTLMRFTCMYRTPDEMWESFVGMFAAGGLTCKSNGLGTAAFRAKIDAEGTKHWEPYHSRNAEGNDTTECQLKSCPDFISGKCKLHGRLKVYPNIDLSMTPYRYDTTSEGAIAQIESMLHRVWSMLRTSHIIRCQTAGKKLKFDGLLGTQWVLNVIQFKGSHGINSNVELQPGTSLQKYIMAPIQEELTKVQQAQVAGKDATFMSFENAPALEDQSAPPAVPDQTTPAETADVVADEFAEAADALLES